MEPIGPIPSYIDSAKALPPEVAVCLLTKSHTRFANQPGYFLLQPVEKVALQLQFDEESLREWRHQVVALRSANAKT